MEEIKEIFNKIDIAINNSLTKGICINFMREYEFIKKIYLGEK